MDRAAFEHVVAAAAEVVGLDEIVVVGSQAILGSFPDAPPELLRSMEADVYPRQRPEEAIRIDGALGDGSRFHEAFGYYAHGVGPDTAKAPRGWESRLVAVPIEPRGASERRPVALCLEPHDLVLSKCVAGREQDWEFAGRAIDAGIVQGDELVRRVSALPVALQARRHVEAMLVSLIEGAG